MRVSLLFVSLVALVLSATSVVEAKTGVALKCAPGYTVSAIPCRAPATAGTPVAGSGYCCSCPFGTFSDGTTCKQCSASSSTVAQSGVDLQKWGAQCSCLPGFGDYNPTTLTCRRCPANTYSSNNQCLPCASGTFAAPQSSQCTFIQCPADSYLPPGGSTLADCTRCKFGAAGQSCSNVQSCRCSTGYASFNATTGMCQSCGNNAIAVFASPNAPDETKTVCVDCPLGSVASLDRRTCNLPTTTTTTPQKPTENTRAVHTMQQETSSSTTAFPYPSNPIPSGCLCSNGFDYAISAENSATPKLNMYAKLDHSATLDADYVQQSIPNLTPATYLVNLADSNVFIIDADSGYAVAGLVVNPGGFTLYGSGHGYFLNYFGKTCDQLQSQGNTKRRLLADQQVVSSNQVVCLTVKQGTSTDLIPQLQKQFGNGIANGWTLNFFYQCAQAAAPLSCSSQGTVYLSSTNNFGFSSSGGFAPEQVTFGSGSANFGSKVLAFYDAAGNVRFVLGSVRSVASSNFLTSYATLNAAAQAQYNMIFSSSHPLVGKRCDPSGTVWCQALTTQWTPMAPILNYLSPGAVINGSPVMWYSYCQTKSNL